MTGKCQAKERFKVMIHLENCGKPDGVGLCGTIGNDDANTMKSSVVESRCSECLHNALMQRK